MNPAAVAPSPSLPVHPPRSAHWLPALVGALLLGLIALVFVGQAPDFVSYTDYFSVLRSGSLDDIVSQRFEPFFALVALPLVRALPSDVLVVALLAALSLFIKWLALQRLAASQKAFLLAGLLYICRFAPLHEITQIRIALALSLWMLALTRVHRRSFWLLLVLMPLTHYSTLVLVPLTLAWRTLQRAPARRQQLFWALAFGLALLVGVTLKLLIGPLSAVFTILSVYSGNGFGDDTVHLLNSSTVTDALFLTSAWLLPRPTAAQRFWLRVVALALVVFVATDAFPVIAHRLYEMLNIAWIPYVATAAAQRGWRGLHAKALVAVSVPLYLYQHAFGSMPVLQP